LEQSVAAIQTKRGRSKSEEKRSQIIDAAAQLFVEQGYENVSMDNIAKQAGVSKQTVYSHFGTKEQLLSYSIESKVEEYQLGRPNLDSNTDPEKYLQAFCIHMAELLMSDAALGMYRVCVSDAGRSDVGKLFWDAGPVKIREQLATFLQQQCDRKVFNIPDIEMACVQLIAMLHGEVHCCAVLGLGGDQAKMSLNDYALSCADLFLRAYRIPA
jgi:TetR/AcrR family transcriptional regulator, mexJK operon transcriptional repressor